MVHPVAKVGYDSGWSNCPVALKIRKYLRNVCNATYTYTVLLHKIVIHIRQSIIVNIRNI